MIDHIGVSLEASDIVIMNDDPTKIIDAYNIAKITKKRVNVSIYLSIIIKILSLILGLIGLIPISVIVLINLIITVLSLLIYKLPNFNKY